MSIVIIGLAAGTMLVMAIILSYVLGWANHAFHVEIDPRIEAVIDALPGANCGGCAYVGCGEYAEAVVMGGASVNECAPGGAGCSEALGNIMGIEVEESLPNRPIVHCGAHFEDRIGRNEYVGEKTCMTANTVAGIQHCTYGCLGFGDCVDACLYDAVHVINGLATVDYEKCIGCGACEKACPRNIVSMAPFKAEQMVAVNCSSKDAGKDVKNACKVGCIACKACTRQSGLFVVENNLATLNYDDYDPENLEDVLKTFEKCKPGTIQFTGKASGKR
jgi:electron transport complex protein RnfB